MGRGINVFSTLLFLDSFVYICNCPTPVPRLMPSPDLSRREEKVFFRQPHRTFQPSPRSRLSIYRRPGPHAIGRVNRWDHLKAASPALS